MLSELMRLMAFPGNADVQVRRPRNQRSACPAVSVIIPCYKYGHFLPQCVKSILDQEDVRVDILIVDDASPDGSAEIARHLAEQEPRVRTICHTKNQGHIATINEGLIQATGDYTVSLSADDLLTPGCLSRATLLMEQNPAVGLTYGFPVEFTDPDLPHARTVAANWIIWPGHAWIAQVCKSGRNVVLSPEVVMRTSVLHETGYFRADLPHSGDLERWMRAAAVCDVGYVSGADQAYYRHHSANMHRSYDETADMSERLLAFDTLFAEHSQLLTGVDIMSSAAHCAVAREALDRAISA